MTYEPTYQPNYEPNYEQRQKINSAEAALFEQILWKIHEGEVDSIDKAREALYECDWNECAAIGLSLEDRLDMIQEFGPDLDLDMGEVALNDLQGKLESLAVAVIHHLAEQRVAERLGELEDLMDEHGLEFENITEANNYGYFVHRAERYPAEGCTVMEYRGVEDPDQAVDVWEVRLDDCWNIYFEVQPEGE